MLPIVVMLWRLYIARKRKLILTIVEFLFPVAIFVAYLVIKQKLESGSSDLEPDPSAYPVAAAPLRVCYSPDTELTKALMDEAGRRLFLNRLDHVPGELEEGFAPVSDSVTMAEYSEIMEVGDAIVEFQGMYGSSFPEKLKYTIRMKSVMRAHNLVKIVMGSGEVPNKFDAIYEPFVRLQWALDISFLQLTTGVYINPTLTLEAVHKDDSSADYIPVYNLLAPLQCILILHASKMALFAPILFFIMRLADEKNSGIEELLKLTNMSKYTLYGLHYINMIPVVLIYALGVPLCLKLGQKPILPATSYFLLVLVFALEMWSVIAFAGFITSIFVPKRAFAFAMVAYGVIAMVIPIASSLLIKYIGNAVNIVLVFVPLEPFQWILQGISFFEVLDQGAGFGALPKTINPKKKPYLNIGECCIALLMQTLIYFELGLYMSRIIPGPYGETQDAGSIFSCLKKAPPEAPVEDSMKAVKPDPKYFEQLPSNLPVGIRIKQVTKVFPKHVALASLDLDVFKGEITLLLGHNGAGKTTLMNIITGMYNPTSGKVEINGIDVQENRSEAYKHLGLCPQHNLFFPDLTVMEHAMIFALLKGFTVEQATHSACLIIKQLGLEGKEDKFPSTLSGGMKRRVQLACALAGDSSVLILDEPTSGLDVETRRGLWDLLLSLRGDRTVLLTTHFMEEADALGDRVAALHNGHLKCHATPMFLKNAIGGGYRLTITMEETKADDITDLIRESVPRASVCDKTHKVVTYNLPSKDSSNFPKMFFDLEENKDSLGIVSIGVGKSTLDEVFIRLCSDTITKFDDVSFVPERKVEYITGIHLYLRMFIVLMQRQLRFVRVNLISYLLMHALLPIIIAFGGGYLINQRILLEESNSNSASNTQPNDLRGNHDMYTVLTGSNASLPRVGYEYVDSKRAMNPAEDLLLRSDDKGYQINVEYNDSHAKATYGASVRQAAPVAVNLLSNLLAQRWLGSSGTGITVLNQPIDDESEMYAETEVPQKTDFTLLLYGILLALQGAQITSFSITLAVKELTTGTRHIHQMCGCPLTLYWAVTLTFHFIAILLFGIAANMISLSLLDEENILNDAGFLLSSSLIAFLGTFAYTTLYFAVGTKLSESLSSLVMNFLLVVFASSGNYESYFRMDSDGAGKQLLFLSIQTCFAVWLLFMLDSGVFSQLGEKWTSCKGNQKSRFTDSLVAAERKHVAKAIRKPRKDVEEALLLYDVHKKYTTWCSPFMAVNGLNISVKRRECYGLLGINGAGKSTTFKMITGETYPTRGHLLSNGYYINEKIAYMKTFSYCPQFFGLDDFLTGKQNMILVLTLRGLSAADAQEQAESWLTEIGLTQYANQCVSGYSGGCARRLAAVAALCQHSHIALLDEPTTGVDTAARRRVHAAVLRAKRTKSVVIASHSMDEIEALCDRICIMSAGEVAALGTAAELRARHATGFSAVFKLSAPNAIMVADKGTMAPEKAVERKGAGKSAQTGKENQEGKSPPPPEHPKKRAFMQRMQASFDCRVVDDHRTMCHFHINDLMPYSKLFGIIEDLKQSYSDLIEDYVVSETTLEEVFIAIAKEGQQYIESQKKKPQNK